MAVPLSESQILTQVLTSIKRAARQTTVDAAMPFLREAVIGLSALRDQAQRGVHANPGVSGETAVEHIRNAQTLVMYFPGTTTDEQSDVLASIMTRLDYALEDLERWRGGNPYSPRARYSHARLMPPAACLPGTFRTVPTGRGRKLVVCRTKGGKGKMRAQSILRPKRARGSFRNPPLVVLGGNPPPAPIEATWARIEYRRPDDPEGKKIVRDHEFEDGFIAEPRSDGSILLRHPRGARLWTQR